MDFGNRVSAALECKVVQLDSVTASSNYRTLEWNPASQGATVIVGDTDVRTFTDVKFSNDYTPSPGDTVCIINQFPGASHVALEAYLNSYPSSRARTYYTYTHEGEWVSSLDDDTGPMLAGHWDTNGVSGPPALDRCPIGRGIDLAV